MKKRLLSVSLVMYCNDIDELTTAITCTLKSDLVGKIYLIDNSPTNLLKILKEINTEKIEYLFQNANLGFGKAHNIGISNSINEGYKYHLILNPDVEFEENVLEKLFAFMESNNNCGMVMPKVFYKNGDLQYLCKKIPSAIEMFGKRLPFKGMQQEINKSLELHHFDYDAILNVPYLSGCFMFCSVNALQNVGGFDDRYFMYMEDLDLSRRMHEKYETIFFPNVSIFHGYRSESKVNKKLLIALIVSAIKYFNKFGWVIDLKKERYNRILNESILELNSKKKSFNNKEILN